MFGPTFGYGTNAYVSARICTPLVELDSGRRSAGTESSPHSHKFSPYFFKKTSPKARALKWVHTEGVSKERTTGNSQEFPKCLVLESDSGKPISKTSPFLVSKVLEVHSGKNVKAKTIFNDDLVVQVKFKFKSR